MKKRPEQKGKDHAKTLIENAKVIYARFGNNLAFTGVDVVKFFHMLKELEQLGYKTCGVRTLRFEKTRKAT